MKMSQNLSLNPTLNPKCLLNNSPVSEEAAEGAAAAGQPGVQLLGAEALGILVHEHRREETAQAGDLQGLSKIRKAVVDGVRPGGGGGGGRGGLGGGGHLAKWEVRWRMASGDLGGNRRRRR